MWARGAAAHPRFGAVPPPPPPNAEGIPLGKLKYCSTGFRDFFHHKNAADKNATDSVENYYKAFYFNAITEICN